MTVRLALATFLAIAAVPASSANDATCTAYMEADAHLETARNAVRIIAEAKQAAIDRYYAAHNAHYNAGIVPLLAPHDWERRREHRLQRAETVLFAAVAEWREISDALVDAKDKLQTAEQLLPDAYRQIYKGPLSAVDSVMDRLIAADRERCLKTLTGG